MRTALAPLLYVLAAVLFLWEVVQRLLGVRLARPQAQNAAARIPRAAPAAARTLLVPPSAAWHLKQEK